MEHKKALLWAGGFGLIAFSIGYTLLLGFSAVLYLLFRLLSPDLAGSPTGLYRAIFSISEWLPYWVWGTIAGVGFYYILFIRPLPLPWRGLLMAIVIFCALWHMNYFRIDIVFSVDSLPGNIFRVIFLLISFGLLRWMLRNFEAITTQVASWWEQLLNR